MALQTSFAFHPEVELVIHSQGGTLCFLFILLPFDSSTLGGMGGRGGDVVRLTN